LQAELRYDTPRRYYLKISEIEFQDRDMPDVLVNRYRKKGYIECQTLDLVKLNQRIQDSHQEVVLMSDRTIGDLLEGVRSEIPALYRVCESIAMLDMLAAFAKLVTVQEYVRPEITNSLAIKAGRHPIHEKVNPPERYRINQTLIRP
jgi:DNA mismatch repair protein MSH4